LPSLPPIKLCRQLVSSAFSRSWWKNLDPRQSLQTRLGLSTAATTIALSLFLSFCIGEIARIQLEERIEKNLEDLAKTAATSLDNGMFERYRDIQSLALMHDIKSPDRLPLQKRELLEAEKLTYPAYAWIGITDRRGVVIASTQGLLEGLLEGKDVSQRSWYQNARNGIYVGDVHEATLLAQLLPNPTQEPLRFVDISAAIQDDRGNYAGTIGTHLNWDWAKEVKDSLGSRLTEEGIEFYILSASNKVLLSSQNWDGKEFKLPSNRDGNLSDSGYVVDSWMRGKKYVIGFADTHGYRSYPGLGWRVAIGQEKSIALAPARLLRERVFAIGIALGLGFALLNWFRSRRIVKPLKDLTNTAQQISNGDRYIDIPIYDNRHDELATLSTAFKCMLANINDRQEELAIMNQKLLSDIARRELLEHQAREQAALLDIATDAIFVRDLTGTILFWNLGAQRMYGWSAEEALGKDAMELLNLDLSPHLTEAWQNVMERGEWRGELNTFTKAGKNIVVGSHWTLAKDEKDRPRFVLTVDTDITDKKELEAQFLRAQRLESLGVLAGGIAHDMNNILTPIMASSQLLAIKLVDAEDRTKRLIEISSDSAKRGADLVKQILSFARGLEGEKTLVQPRHILKEIEKIIKSTFDKNITIEFDIPTQQLWTISADASQLHQVLMNLCINARDAMINGGTLAISARNSTIDSSHLKIHVDAKIGDYLTIEIVDTGSGMPPAILDRIFEPFYTTKELGKGTGLGLSTTLGIIKSHGGFITVDSQVDRGTTFTVYLPAEATAVEIAAAEISPLMGNGESILIIDDEILILEMLKNSLEAYNYHPIAAKNGMEALLYHQENHHRIKAAIVDMMMPGLNGIATIDLLKKNNPNLKVIATTGLVSEDTIPPNIDLFLPKPYPLNNLLHSLQHILST
jgi:PAS domain S-box-containing protein